MRPLNTTTRSSSSTSQTEVSGDRRANRPLGAQPFIRRAVAATILVVGLSLWGCLPTAQHPESGATTAESATDDTQEKNAKRKDEVTEKITGTKVETQTPSRIDWRTDWVGAQQEALQNEQPILLVFHAPWCVPCRMLDQHVWSDSVLKRLVMKSAVPVRIELDSIQESSLAQQYNVSFVPTILLLDAHGQIIERRGYSDAEEMKKLLRTNRNSEQEHRQQ